MCVVSEKLQVNIRACRFKWLENVRILLGHSCNHGDSLVVGRAANCSKSGAPPGTRWEDPSLASMSSNVT